MRLIPTNRLTPHPEAQRVPQMTAEQFAEFLEDIRERGVLIPIEVVDRHTIIDGRTRWLAAKQLGIRRVPVVNAPLNGIPAVIYMLRAASKRRHLTDDQRACLAQEEMEYLAEIGRRRRAQAGGMAGGRGRARVKLDDSSANGAIAEQKDRDRSSDARTVAARGYAVSHRRLQCAHRLRREAPSLFRKVKAGELRLAEAQRVADRQAKRQIQNELARKARGIRCRESWNIIVGDAVANMRQLQPASVRLIFADPPYNIGIDYGQGSQADRLPDDRYLAWCREWMAACVKLLTDDGSLWVMINDEYADHYGMLLRETGLPRRAWIKWYETFGVNCSNNFNRCSRHIFYHAKNPRRFIFNPDAITRASDRQSKYRDRRADPAGKLWDNVWCIPRLVENSQERLPDFPTQLPLALLRPIVLCASHPGDLVLDPFSGSGTTGAAAVESARRFVGIERSSSFARESRQRLKLVAAAHGTQVPQ